MYRKLPLLIIVSLIITHLTSLRAQQILFTEKSKDTWNLKVFDVEKNEYAEIAQSASRDFQARYSEVANAIAFDSYRDAETRNLFILNLTNNEISQITDLDTRDGHPSWSSDGKKLHFNQDEQVILRFIFLTYPQMTYCGLLIQKNLMEFRHSVRMTQNWLLILQGVNPLI